LDVAKGFHTFWEVFQLAAEDIAKDGRGNFVRAKLTRGKVRRAIVAALCGVSKPDRGTGYGHRPDFETLTASSNLSG
jgi:hypothetical protein